MAEYTLEAKSPLAGYAERFGTLHLAERTGFGLVSLAVPLGGDKPAAAALKKAWGLAAPAPGRSVVAKDGTRLIWSGPDQLLALFDHPGHGAEARVAEATGGAFHTTDQSDNWVALSLAGPGARAALERLCPLDLHDDAFPVDAAGRTVMEHMGAFIVREAEDDYLLMSASSSARSFLHAVEHSIHYTA